MDSIFYGFSHIDEDFYEELEETLIMGDLGVHTTMRILEDLREKVEGTAYQGTGRLPPIADGRHQKRANGCQRQGLPV